MAEKDRKGPKNEDVTLTATTPEPARDEQAAKLKETVEALKHGFTIDFGHPTIESSFTPDNIFRFFTGEITQAELLGITREDALAFSQYAYQQYQAGRFNDAKRIFASLVTLDPGNAYAHAMLGACLQMLDEKEIALREYTQAIDIDGNNLQARVNRADLLLQQNKFAEALEDLKHVVAIDPKNNDPATQRARALAAATAQSLGQMLELMKKQGK